jgi:competence protein ComGC
VGGLAGDEGITLTELVVTMGIMSIFMTIFTAGVLQMFRVVNGSDSVSVVQSQLNTTFLRLDRQIRYASAITTPGSVTSGGYLNTYVEYLDTTGASPVCGQLRLQVAVGAANGQLQARSWTASGTPPASWTVLASGVSGSPPFVLWPVDDTSNFQRLEIDLTIQSGTGTSAASRTSDVTFTAVNSQPDDSAAPGQAPDPSVCALSRP